MVSVLVVFAWLGAGEAQAGMIETDGLKPWEVCALCHNLNGIGRTARFPHLAGQRSAYIQKQLKDFRAGHRANDNGQMVTIVEAELSTDNVSKVADYFASLAPPEPVESDAGSEDLAEGKRLFHKGRPAGGLPACAVCHGASKPEIAYAPHLTAQHARYVAKQLDDFKSGARKNDATGTMARIAAQLSDRDIKNIAAYVASQRRGRP